MATPLVVSPSPDIEQPCRQLQDSPMCRAPESRQPWLLWIFSAICCSRIVFLRNTESSTHPSPRKQPESSSSSSSIDRFRPLCRESSRRTGDALLPPPADDYICSGMDTPDSVGRREPFPGSEYPSSLPACATVWLVLSAGPSGASDWVGFQDPDVAVIEIFDLCNARDPGGGRVSTVWTAESFMQTLGVRRSAVYRWKPGLCIAAASRVAAGCLESLRL